ncbi:MAG: hypothetical protein RIC38_16130 [Chromatocurvus sp.]
MEAILTLVGILGVGALLISVYVFAVAARKFVSDDEEKKLQFSTSRASNDGWIPRNSDDRRQNRGTVQFPIRVNGQLVLHDRRKGDRRAA